MTRPHFTNIATRMFNTPLLLHPEKGEVIATAFSDRVWFGARGGEHAPTLTFDGSHQAPPEQAGVLGDEFTRWAIKRQAGYSNIEGVAIIPVNGSLVRRGAYMGNSSGVTSYEGIRAALLAAANDRDVRAIALEIESPGGEVAGCFELCETIREVRAAMPVHAFVADYAFSAGYALAAQAHSITLPKFGSVGSIGVITMHIDQSEALKKDGLKLTVIQAGRHKTDGFSHQPLAPEVAEKLQNRVNQLWVEFARQVELGRGEALTMDAALKTEAACFEGADALKAGLADKLADPKKAFEAMVAEITGGPPVAIAANAAAGKAVNNSINLGALMRPVSLAPSGSETNCGIGHISAGVLPGTIKETVMENEEQNQAVLPPASNDDPGDMAVGGKPTDAGKAERIRSRKILTAVETAGLPISLATELIASGVTTEEALTRVIDERAKSGNDGGDINASTPAAAVTSDSVDRMREGMTKALMKKAGMDGGERNEFTSMSLREMGRHTLEVRGLKPPSGGVQEMAAAVFVPSMVGGLHSTSDFGNILADVASKSMLRGFEEVAETYEQWTSMGTLTDFKVSKRVGLSAFPVLDAVEPGASYSYATLEDYGEDVALATYGKMFAITRQVIINDDLSAFTTIPQKMGRAARRTVGNLAYSVLSANANMGDGNPLFDAAHGNLAGAGAAVSETTLNTAITAMATQKDRSAAATALNIAPRFLLAPPSLRAAVLQTLNSEYAPDDTSKSGTTKQPRAHNTVRDAAEPIFDARLTGTAWYMAADPVQADTVEISYLDGQSEPFLDQQDGWNVDGTEFKVRLDAAAKALAWEGLYKNPGA